MLRPAPSPRSITIGPPVPRLARGSREPRSDRLTRRVEACNAADGQNSLLCGRCPRPRPASGYGRIPRGRPIWSPPWWMSYPGEVHPLAGSSPRTPRTPPTVSRTMEPESSGGSPADGPYGAVLLSTGRRHLDVPQCPQCSVPPPAWLAADRVDGTERRLSTQGSRRSQPDPRQHVGRAHQLRGGGRRAPVDRHPVACRAAPTGEPDRPGFRHRGIRFPQRRRSVREPAGADAPSCLLPG